MKPLPALYENASVKIIISVGFLALVVLKYSSLKLFNAFLNSFINLSTTLVLLCSTFLLL